MLKINTHLESSSSLLTFVVPLAQKNQNSRRLCWCWYFRIRYSCSAHTWNWRAVCLKWSLLLHDDVCWNTWSLNFNSCFRILWFTLLIGFLTGFCRELEISYMLPLLTRSPEDDLHVFVVCLHSSTFSFAVTFLLSSNFYIFAVVVDLWWTFKSLRQILNFLSYT